jgi:hypothetical protein
MSLRRWSDLLLLSALVGLVAALPLPGQGAAAQVPVSLVLDLDPSAPGIQSTREVAPGDSFAVDVIAEGVPQGSPVAALQFNLVYDDTVILAPEVPDEGNALDDNPDANQEALGPKGWDCSVFGAAFPQGDKDPVSGPGHGEAFIACLNPVGPYPATGNVTLATVRFNVVGSSGQSTLQLEEAVVDEENGSELGTCNPVVYLDAGCQPGQVTIGQAAPPPAGEETAAAPEETPAGREATPAGQEATPIAATTLPPPSAEESGGPWPWPGLGWVLAGLAAAGAVGGAVLYLRARLARRP